MDFDRGELVCAEPAADRVKRARAAAALAGGRRVDLDHPAPVLPNEPGAPNVASSSASDSARAQTTSRSESPHSLSSCMTSPCSSARALSGARETGVVGPTADRRCGKLLNLFRFTPRGARFRFVDRFAGWTRSTCFLGLRALVVSSMPRLGVGVTYRSSAWCLTANPSVAASSVLAPRRLAHQATSVSAPHCEFRLDPALDMVAIGLLAAVVACVVFRRRDLASA